MKLLFATGNRGKVSEIKDLLAGSGWEVSTPADSGMQFEVEEDGVTFEANARKKAHVAHAATGGWSLADDSGLEVDALGGMPGVQSARYAGPGAKDEDRYWKLLEELASVPDSERSARFRCVMCLVDPLEHEKVFSGICEGHIIHAPRGSSGFGYDPVFVPDGYEQTFAELGLDVKNRISHRARAMAQVVRWLRDRG